MKLTTAKIIRAIESKYNWSGLSLREKLLIKDVRTIIDEHLKKQKGLTIK